MIRVFLATISNINLPFLQRDFPAPARLHLLDKQKMQDKNYAFHIQSKDLLIASSNLYLWLKSNETSSAVLSWGAVYYTVHGCSNKRIYFQFFECVGKNP